MTATIEDRACALLLPHLAVCVQQRTRLGIQKYGQRLDDNVQDVVSKAVHLVQELLDAVQYALWLDDDRLAMTLAAHANVVATTYALTTDEILAGGKA
ncbi:hypothetical protein [uncultured Deinococcus sp.]|uniref:hypothetical protein n=1 Tax=uncultured Deinococcus sp. TaxID=158789 RepID=UPI0025F8D957|nr:hypothetical protein [uncultured Deinococcus sp.]